MDLEKEIKRIEMILNIGNDTAIAVSGGRYHLEQCLEWMKELQRWRKTGERISQIIIDFYTSVGAEDTLYDIVKEREEERNENLEKEIEADKGVLEKINEKQDSLRATCKAWDEAIQKKGYVN